MEAGSEIMIPGYVQRVVPRRIIPVCRYNRIGYCNTVEPRFGSRCGEAGVDRAEYFLCSHLDRLCSTKSHPSAQIILEHGQHDPMVTIEIRPMDACLPGEFKRHALLQADEDGDNALDNEVPDKSA